MNTYKTASALEGLFDLAYDDKIRIESFSRTHAHTNENEEYLVTIRVIRKNAEEKEQETSADTERTAHPGTNPKEQIEKTGEKTGEKNGEKSGENPAAETASAGTETPSAAAGAP